LLLKRPKESAPRNVLRDARRSTSIATTIEARGHRRGAITIATIDVTGKGAGIETVTEAGTIALGSTILMMMVIATSGLDIREGKAKMTPKGIDTGIRTGNMLGTKNQASSHRRIRRRNSLCQTKRYLEKRPPPWKETPG
jgi:hypothetical protein